MTTANLLSQVDATSERIETVITDRRSDAIETFEQLSADQQRLLALDAWTIGLRALKNAYTQAQESRLSDIGRTLKDDLSGALVTLVQQHQERLEGAMRRYFDPNDGELTRRLDQFIEDDGELAQLLSQFIGPEGSLLADTLAHQVGEQSPLFRKLSPTDAQGLVQTLKQQLALALGQSQVDLQKALDPLQKDGPIARFLGSLREEMKKAENDRSLQMTTAFKALDANDPNSLLSNLARQTKDASHALLNAVNPANANSPLAALRNTLTEMLDAHIKTSREMLVAQQQRQERFEKDIRDVVTRLETQRSSNRTTPRGGTVFEDDVEATVQDFVRGSPYVCSKTGNVVGIRDSCKVGDFVIRFTEESAWAGTTIVFECKHDQTYHVDKSLKELDTARANRDASVGVFVMAASHAPVDFPLFARHGHNILVTWDPEDPTTLPRLQAATMLALALATRKQGARDDASIDAIKDIEIVLAEQLARIEKMRKASDGIRKHNDSIRKELQKAEDDLRDLVEKSRETLRALNLVDDEALERAAPIEFETDESGESAA